MAKVERLTELLDFACDQCGLRTSGEQHADGTPLCSGCAVYDWRKEEE